MRYVLCRYAIGQSGEIDITEEEYSRLDADVRCLVEISDVEEKFNAFVDNYFELELALLEAALRSLVYETKHSAEFFEPKNIANRRAINLFTSVRLYLDALPQHANKLLTGELLQKVKAAPSAAYDRSLAYRAMEALRNYAQHQAFPVHGWLVNMRWDDTTQPSLMKAQVVPSLNLDALEDAHFKKSVLKELREIEEPVLLKPLIREYVEQLALVHADFRSAARPLITDAVQRIDGAAERFLSAFPGSRTAVVALPVDPGGYRAGDPVYLSPTVLEYLPKLQERIGSLVNLSRRRVDH